MTSRPLFALLIALSLLVAPAFTRAGEAVAAASVHHAEKIDDGHCGSAPEEPGGHGKAAEKNCGSMCTATAVASAASLGETVPAPATPVFAVPSLHLSYLGEIATPPPKAA